MKLETMIAPRLSLAALAAAVAAFAMVLLLAALPARASVGPPSAEKATSPLRNSQAALAEAQLGSLYPSATEPTLIASALGGRPRCTLDITQPSYHDGDTVRAALRLSNPTTTVAEVEMKIWFSAPGEAPLSLADPLEAGRTLELPAMLDRDSGLLRLFAVDESTPRGVYEMNCRLIDPVTGSTLSEDLNAFRVH